MEKRWYDRDFKLGILGGGQLGRMFIQKALSYDAHVYSIDPDPSAPCRNIASKFEVGSLLDYDTVLNFGKDKDVLTIEIENVNVEALEDLEKTGVKVFPQPRLLRIIKDKGLQKQFYKDNNIPTSDFQLFDNAAEVIASCKPPFVQKLRTGGYDGKGVRVVKTTKDLQYCFDAPSVVESLVPFEKELSVIVARNENGQMAVYPTVECEFNPEANLVEFLFSPAQVDKGIETKARQLALEVVQKMGMVGILAVELFLTGNGELLVNEVAPRPHNSGHHSIEGNHTSQFEQHFRSIINLPLGDTGITLPAVMINLLGAKGYSGPVHYDGLEKCLETENVHVHLYGKAETKPFRKMGHVTICDQNIENAKIKAREIRKSLQVVCK
jgi:5-(carboxyamino)imidazole ribonucleotide synthase